MRRATAKGPTETRPFASVTGAYLDRVLASIGLDRGKLLLTPLIPWRPADDARLASTRVLITAGRRDPICPPALTQTLADFWARQGAETRVEWHDGGHELRESEIEALKRWSGAAK